MCRLPAFVHTPSIVCSLSPSPPPSFPSHPNLTPLPSTSLSHLYLSNPSPSAAPLVLKLTTLSSWDSLSNFQHERLLLSSLSHPILPHFHSSFTHDTQTTRYFVLVFHSFPGYTLAHHLHLQHRFPPNFVQSLLLQLLQLLNYLNSLSPQVLHGNLTTSSIVVGNHADHYRISVLDFVKHPITDDLTAVAKVLLELITGKEEHQWTIKNGQIDVDTMVRGRAHNLKNVIRVVKGLLNGIYTTPHQALTALQPPQLPTTNPAPPLKRGLAQRGRITILRNDEQQVFHVHIKGEPFNEDTVVKGVFLTMWLGITGLWTVGAGLAWGWFSVPFWMAGWRMAREIRNRFGDVQLSIDNDIWTINQQEANLDDIEDVKIVNDAVVIQANGKQSTIAGLSTEESQWVCKQLRDYLSGCLPGFNTQIQTGFGTTIQHDNHLL